MTINELLMRARDYMYDRRGFEDFVEELLEAPDDEREAVAVYLAGHSLAIGRWVTSERGREKHGPWFWLDDVYVPAIAATIGEGRSLHVVGRGYMETKADLEVLGFGG